MYASGRFIAQTASATPDGRKMKASYVVEVLFRPPMYKFFSRFRLESPGRACPVTSTPFNTSEPSVPTREARTVFQSNMVTRCWLIISTGPLPRLKLRFGEQD